MEIVVGLMILAPFVILGTWAYLRNGGFGGGDGSAGHS